MGCMFSRNPKNSNSRRSSLSSVNETILGENVFLLTEENINDIMGQMNIKEHRETIKVLKFDGVRAAERYIKEKLRYNVYNLFDHTFLERSEAERQAMLREFALREAAMAPPPVVPVPVPERDSPEPDYSFYTESEFVSSHDLVMDLKEMAATEGFEPRVLVENNGVFSFDPIRSNFKSMPSVRIAVAIAPSGFVSAFCLDRTFKFDLNDKNTDKNEMLLVQSEDEQKVPENTVSEQPEDNKAFQRRTLARSSTFKMVDFAHQDGSGLKKKHRQGFESTASLYEPSLRPKVAVLMCASEKHIARQNFSMDANMEAQGIKEDKKIVQQVQSPAVRRPNMRTLKAKAQAMRDTAKSMPALQDEQLFAETQNLSTSDRFLLQLGESEVVPEKKVTLTPSNSFKFCRDDLSATPRATFKTGAASLGALGADSEPNVARSGRSLTPSASFKMSSFVRKEQSD